MCHLHFLVDTACLSQRHHRRLVKLKSWKEGEKVKEITTGRRLNHRAASLPLFDEAEKVDNMGVTEGDPRDEKTRTHSESKGMAGRITEKQAKWCRGYRTEKRKPPL